MAAENRMGGAGAAAALAASAPGLGTVFSLPAFLDTAGHLTLDEQKAVVDQALAMLQDVYVHLPLKRAMHAIDPLQSLRLLRRQLETKADPMKERKFHNQMITIFMGLRDLHTNYILPSYFADYIAFLPFYLEEFFADQRSDSCQYVVSKIAGLNDPNFKEGVVVKYWNGIPIDRAVELNAERNAGSNPDARHARGLESMTLRPMAMSLPPDEEWVVIGYNDGEQDREIRLQWQVYRPDAQGGLAPAPSGQGAAARAVGMDFLTETVRRTKVRLFAPQVHRKARELAAAQSYGRSDAAGLDSSTTSSMPDILRFRTVDTPAGPVGYLRIYSFAPPDDRQDAMDFVNAFGAEVIRILQLLPQDGLILDVRGNGGGIIMAGEKLLQLFTPEPIVPERFDFINTPITRALVDQYTDLQPWAQSMDQAVETGATYSQGFPLTSEEEANATGQVYQGPVVLITNALIYSTTDIFSAGFKDHKIGPILGTGGNTGAGGANVWDYAFLQQVLPDTFKALPQGTSMRVALRRSTRVGAMSGVPLEDLGVQPDEVHKMTRNDVFNDNTDLIAHAASLLQRKARSLNGTVETAGGKRTLKVQTKNLSRVDIYQNRRPIASVDVHDGETEVDLPAPAGNLCLQGFAGGQLVVSKNLA